MNGRVRKDYAVPNPALGNLMNEIIRKITCVCLVMCLLSTSSNVMTKMKYIF